MIEGSEKSAQAGVLACAITGIDDNTVHAQSPDLNPVDYKIWSIMQERVYKTRIRDVAHLQERLREEWAAFNHGIIERAVQQWRIRLRACIRAEGGHFEYQL